MTKMRTLILSLSTVAALAVSSLSASPAFASTPLPAPTNLEAMHVSDTAADLDWLSNGATSQDVVEQEVNGVWREFTRNLGGSLALTGLTKATTYTFRVYSIPVAGLGYTTSARSAPLSFTTLSGPDTVAPAKPGTPSFSSITTTGANVFWPQTTDNVQVTGYYLQQLISGVWTTIRTVGPAGNFQSVGGLAAGSSYAFAVIAFDVKGNQSARSDPGTVTTLANTAGVTCVVQTNIYNLSFSTTITVTNTAAAPLSGWTIHFTDPPTTTVAGSFNGTLTQTGTAVTITPAVYFNPLTPGVQAFFGFSGSTSSGTTLNLPTGYTAAGTACTGS